MKKLKTWLIAGVLTLAPLYALGDYTITQGSGSTVFSFVCFTTKICPAHTLVNSAGTEVATSGNPLRIDPTGTTTQPVNNAQVNGVTLLAGNGVTGTGSQRVTIASDNSPIAGAGVGATGSAVPANANFMGTRQSGNLAGVIGCDNSIVYDASTSGSTQLVALTASQTIYVCGYTILSAGTVNARLVYGTGTNCGTGTTSMTPAYQLTAQTGAVDGSSFHRGLKTASANALCINTSAAIAVQAIVYYTKF